MMAFREIGAVVSVEKEAETANSTIDHAYTNNSEKNMVVGEAETETEAPNSLIDRAYTNNSEKNNEDGGIVLWFAS